MTGQALSNINPLLRIANASTLGRSKEEWKAHARWATGQARRKAIAPCLRCPGLRETISRAKPRAILHTPDHSAGYGACKVLVRLRLGRQEERSGPSVPELAGAARQITNPLRRAVLVGGG